MKLAGFLKRGEKGSMGVYELISITISICFEVLDIILELVNLTGAGIIILIVIDILRILFLLFLQLAFEGFSFKALFKSWKQAVLIIFFYLIELIPALDLLPGWMITVLAFLSPGKFRGKAKTEMPEPQFQTQKSVQ